MSHARVEEVSDSDLSDPDDMDPSDFDPSSIIAPANIPPASSRQQPPSSARQMPARPMPRQAAAHPESLAAQMRDSAEVQRQREAVKRWQSLYPVYFDVTRSSREGRRVGRKLAVKNPLAREVAEGAAALGLQVAFEPSKMHPKDWANPGRVKVRLRGEDGKVLVPDIQNKNHLFIHVSEWLRAHPTTESSPLKLPIQGLPSKLPPPVNVPKGVKFGTILPLHSPAISGGGVSENMFKDMMNEVQGLGGQPALQDSGPPVKPSKKDKKNKK